MQSTCGGFQIQAPLSDDSVQVGLVLICAEAIAEVLSKRGRKEQPKADERNLEDWEPVHDSIGVPIGCLQSAGTAMTEQTWTFCRLTMGKPIRVRES
jgi:hypothetical protein